MIQESVAAAGAAAQAEVRASGQEPPAPTTADVTATVDPATSIDVSGGAGLRKHAWGGVERTWPRNSPGNARCGSAKRTQPNAARRRAVAACAALRPRPPCPTPRPADEMRRSSGVQAAATAIRFGVHQDVPTFLRGFGWETGELQAGPAMASPPAGACRAAGTMVSRSHL